MAANINVGPEYCNLLWGAGYQTLAWLNTQAYSATGAPNNLSLSQSSLYYIAEAMGMASFIYSLQQQINNLNEILALPVNFGSTTGVMQARLSSLNAFYNSIYNLLPSAPSVAVSSLLSSGSTTVPFSDYVSYFVSYSGETSPDYTISGVTYNASQWASAVSILGGFYGSSPTSLYDTLYNISFCNNIVSGTFNTIVSAQTSGQNVPQNYIYNQLYAVPSIFLAANLASQSFGSYFGQQTLAAKNAMLAMMETIQNTLLVADAPLAFQPIQTTIVYGGEDLQDIAARTLGNFELWPQIATLNNIIPGTDLTPGMQLFLPPIAPTGQVSTNYNINVLGNDLYIGDINNEMLPWAGDFTSISGPANLIYALGRRLQTTLGAFTYHQDYGSRIPPEVGNVQTINTALQIGAFMKSCLLTDPRVSSVSNVTVSSGQGFGNINVVASAVPIGPNQAAVQVNEVITPRS